MEALATFFGLKPKHFVGYLEKRDTGTNYNKDDKITYSSEPLPIPKYTQPYNARGMAYKDAILFENADLVDRPPVLKNVKGAYAVFMPSLNMEPRYRQGDTLSVNPEISPERGDDVVIHLEFKDRTVCIVRELVLTVNLASDDQNEFFRYGVISAMEKHAMLASATDQRNEEKLTLENGEKFDAFKWLIDNYAHWFVEQNPEDEITLLKDGVTGEMFTNDDGDYVTVADANRLAGNLGATNIVTAMAIHTIVGTQRNRFKSAAANLEATSVMTAKPEVGQATVVT